MGSTRFRSFFLGVLCISTRHATRSHSHLRDARRARPEREIPSNDKGVGRGEKRARPVFVLEAYRHFPAIVRASPNSDALERVARRRGDNGRLFGLLLLLLRRLVVQLLLLLRRLQR